MSYISLYIYHIHKHIHTCENLKFVLSLTRNIKCPHNAMKCSTPHTTLSLTHLSISPLAARINAGPATNLKK